MNRLFLLVAVMLVCITVSFGQQADPIKLAPSNNCRNAIIELITDRNGSNVKLPFSSIEVRDIRADTSKLGFYRSTKNFHHYKYCFANSAQGQMENFLNLHFKKNMDAGSPDKLVIYVKKLWLSAFDSSELNTHRSHLKDAWLYVKSEIYLQSNGGYQPVYRFDSVIYARKKNNYTSSGFITSALLQSVSALNTIDYDQVKRKRQFTQAQVDGFNGHYLASQSTKPVKGVYLSFEDFKNNRPTYANFECRFESLADIVYVNENGNQRPVNNIWGFSNGEYVFIRMGANFFPLYTQQNTWEFYGTASMEAKSPRMPVIMGAGLPLAIVSAGAAELANYEKKLVNMRAFQIDIENGKFY